jgi:hypothetical protein
MGTPPLFGTIFRSKLDGGARRQPMMLGWQLQSHWRTLMRLESKLIIDGNDYLT